MSFPHCLLKNPTIIIALSSDSPRAAKRAAIEESIRNGPIVVNESLPFGSDAQDTLDVPAPELDAQADRLGAMPEEPDLGKQSPQPVPWSFEIGYSTLT